MSVLATDYPGPMAILRDAGVETAARSGASHGATPGRSHPRTEAARSSGHAAGAPGLRLTGRGRVVVTILAVVAATFLTFASQQAFAGEGGGAVHVDTRTVVAGETLWEIAREYAHPGQDIRDVVDELAELNGLQTSGLRAGQELLVPAP